MFSKPEKKTSVFENIRIHVDGASKTSVFVAENAVCLWTGDANGEEISVFENIRIRVDGALIGGAIENLSYFSMKNKVVR